MQDNFTTATKTAQQKPAYQGSRPICSLRDGSVSVNIWQNRHGASVYFNVTMERVYTDKTTGDTKSAKSFGLRDIKILQKFFTRAKSEIEKRSIDHLG